ncbi:D-alanine aminotransferase [Afipia carboxidovorans OM5]|uniref:Probable branched-chain-amino-acid aminotransferase n=1 Tax=Afipia carboxidovorans (strain ATCC 49405 / DSM 1227 / KCTC 32145 / OM5) TaxID=504832 RepID=B6JDY9_AFIC5|nr:D-amino-acid transaminase [Afipia carboxidovorans]ACI93214.1 D-alanine aminotransferase [Afipia carboxidovorans OM5]AEI03064.1 D-alanine aminotransferase Dat [Afipia carboxidovorans OM4]AEI06641.1 D-alanine aminotransferase Dat [Afipia carboxidovorans OM5]
MARIAYVNGRYLDLREASVNIEDRGYQFSDGIYEVCEIRDGALVDWPRHRARLKRSLGEVRIAMPMGEAALTAVLHEVMRRNRVHYGLIYLQVTRGVAHREHSFPSPSVKPSLVVTAKNLSFAKNEAQAAHGIAVITLPENRWPRVDIKSVALLPNVLAKQQAKEQGAYEAWFVDRDGFVTEGSSSNAWIVTKSGTIVTRSADSGILPGITRAVLQEVLAALQMRFEERPFTPQEAEEAAEAFVTAATQIVMPVVKIDGKPIGNGVPGPIAAKLRSHFHGFSTFS